MPTAGTLTVLGNLSNKYDFESLFKRRQFTRWRRRIHFYKKSRQRTHYFIHRSNRVF